MSARVRRPARMADPALACGQCGATNPATNNFCGRCGAFLGPEGAAGERQAAPARQGGEPRARVQSALIIAIVAAFALACLLLSVVIIVWRP